MVNNFSGVQPTLHAALSVSSLKPFTGWFLNAQSHSSRWALTFFIDKKVTVRRAAKNLGKIMLPRSALRQARYFTEPTRLDGRVFKWNLFNIILGNPFCNRQKFGSTYL